MYKVRQFRLSNPEITNVNIAKVTGTTYEDKNRGFWIRFGNGHNRIAAITRSSEDPGLIKVHFEGVLGKVLGIATEIE
jgi:hypothetical protein